MFRLADIAPQVRRWGNASLVAGCMLLAGALSSRQVDWPAPAGFALIVLACWSEAGAATVPFGNRLVVWLARFPSRSTLSTGC